MVFGVAVFKEVAAASPTAIESGFYVSTSTDDLNWTHPQKALTMVTVFFTGRTCGVHPTLILPEVSGNSASGMLLYGLSENWGQVPHHLAGCPIHLKLNGSRSSTSSKRLAGSGVRTSEKRKTPDKPTSHRSRQKTASDLEFEQSLAGNYRLELTNLETGDSDSAMTLELHSDKTVTTSDGRSGTWDTTGKRLIVKVPDIKSSAATKTPSQHRQPSPKRQLRNSLKSRRKRTSPQPF
jgi:hypothetical protein